MHLPYKISAYAGEPRDRKSNQNYIVIGFEIEFRNRRTLDRKHRARARCRAIFHRSERRKFNGGSNYAFLERVGIIPGDRSYDIRDSDVRPGRMESASRRE